MSGMAHFVVTGSEETLPAGTAVATDASTPASAGLATVEADAGTATTQEAATTPAASVVDQILASGIDFEAIGYPPHGRPGPAPHAPAPHYKQLPQSSHELQE
ncbi:hypothetical protein GCM10023081_34340 [Arthrobacter ginkgonis]|uniref:Uncharacterized protein n=1 Tax=Arthrobacter ginkgonis TaxID=1630594 RepID=A0ABP7CSL9_9MICC